MYERWKYDGYEKMGISNDREVKGNRGTNVKRTDREDEISIQQEEKIRHWKRGNMKKMVKERCKKG